MHLEAAHWVFIVVIAAWSLIMFFGMWQAHQKEAMRHRERLAMIEKGLPLPPEPSTVSPLQAISGATLTGDPVERERRLLEFVRFIGILTVAAGVGLYLLLTIMDQWRAGVGIGGLMVMLGCGFILTTLRALRVRQKVQ